MDCPNTRVVMKSLKHDFLSGSCLIKDPIRRLQDRMDSKEARVSSYMKMIQKTW